MKNLNGLIFDTEATGPPAALVDLPKDIDSWGCGQWMLYADRLINLLGKDDAKAILLQDFNNTSMWATVNNTCHYDCNFVKYFEALGPEFNFHFVTDIWCSGHKATTDVLDVVTDTTGGLSNTTKLLSLALPAAALYGIYWVATNPEKVKKLF